MTADTLLGQGLWERERVCFFVCHGVRETSVIHYTRDSQIFLST